MTLVFEPTPYARTLARHVERKSFAGTLRREPEKFCRCDARNTLRVLIRVRLAPPTQLARYLLQVFKRYFREVSLA